MSWKTNYAGKLCLASEYFNIYKDTDSISSLIPHEVNPFEIILVFSAENHDTPYDNIEAILEVWFLTNGSI